MRKQTVCLILTNMASLHEAFPLSHKTVLVLDRGGDLAVSCQQPIDVDQITKTRTLIPLAPISKSLWTCAVESAVEYCRIVWDIYPCGRLVRFVMGDGDDSRFLNLWQEQSVAQLMSAFAKIPPPSATLRNKLDIVRAVEMALGTLCEPSEAQHTRRTDLDRADREVPNKGRVIVITQLQGESEILKLEKKLATTLNIVNKVASQDDKQIPLDEVEIVLIHASPGSKEISIAPTRRLYNSPLLAIEIHKVTSGYFLSEKLCQLVQTHYELAITTVTGIPMKEEQNANSSANYDVELLHPLAAHADFLKDKDGCKHDSSSYSKVTLKWCTPRTAPTQELQHCTAAHRITPVDINSRPSSCLTNFLLTGRAVMLELPRKSGQKLLSHMLASHGGEIYIHTLGTGRSALEDPPSISEGSGGRVTDYRITDFGLFMKEHLLIPYNTEPRTGQSHESKMSGGGCSNDNSCPTPLEMTETAIARSTLYWPLVISATAVYNVQSHLEPLLSIIVKPQITSEQVIECKKVILNLVSMEAKGTALALSSVAAVASGLGGGRFAKSGPRKEEHYRALWAELEQLLRLYCSTTEHEQVLDCLLECRRTEGHQAGTPGTGAPGQSTANCSGAGAGDISKNGVAVRSELKPVGSYSGDTSGTPSSPSDDQRPKRLRVAPDLLGKTSLLGLIKENQSRKPATSMWLGLNPETRKATLYQNLKEKQLQQQQQAIKEEQQIQQIQQQQQAAASVAAVIQQQQQQVQ